MQDGEYGTPYENPPIGRWVPEWWLLSNIQKQQGEPELREQWMADHASLLSSAKSCWGVPAIIAEKVPDAQKSQQCRMRMPSDSEMRACM